MKQVQLTNPLQEHLLQQAQEHLKKVVQSHIKQQKGERLLR